MGKSEFERQLTNLKSQAMDELIRRAAADVRIGPEAKFWQQGRRRKFLLPLFLQLYLCPPSRAISDACFGEPGWIISGDSYAELLARLPDEGLPDPMDEDGYAAILGILAEHKVVS